MHKKAPVYLNLTQIHLPLPGVVSLLHRASGTLLFLLLPVFLFLLERSLASSHGFESVRHLLATPWVKLTMLSVAWASLHHIFAGLRVLALDCNWGVELPMARFTSQWVLVAGAVFAALLGVWLW